MIVAAKNTTKDQIMIKKMRDKISLNIGHDDEDEDTRALVRDR